LFGIALHVKHAAKSTANTSRKCQRAIVQIDSSSARQYRANSLQESVKIGKNTFDPQTPLKITQKTTID
jgi:hypothetical protein